ncbi:MAG: twin-arginine translocase TatA/TatE family subunit [Alistipes sp.]|nr:twin-arginine translocase TatA/TatE family subunit [Alistipes sp.]
MLTVLPLFLGKLGMTEILIIVLLVLIFFGGKKIPELMRGMGRGVKEFKDAVSKDYTEENEEDKNGKSEHDA